MEDGQPYFVRTLAMDVMAELVHVDVKMSDASKEVVIQSFLTMLQSTEWGHRRGAVTNVQTIGLLGEPRVHKLVRSMANDPRAEVANRVNRIDWSDPKNGG